MSIATLTRWLELEHEALWTMPVVAARVADRRSASEAALARHAAVATRLEHELERLGAPIPAPPVSHDIGPLESAEDADAVLRLLEDRIAAAALAHVGECEGDERRWALEALAESARAVVTFGGEPEALPGLE